MRFGPTPSENHANRARGAWLVTPSLRLGAMLAAVLLVIAARQRLAEPGTHAALAKLTSTGAEAATQPTNTARSPFTGPPLVDAELLATVRDNAPFRTGEQDAWFATIDVARSIDANRSSDSDATFVPPSPIDYATLVSEAERLRGRLVSVGGIVRRVTAVTPAENELGISTLWEVLLQPDGGDVWPVAVYCLDEPSAVEGDRVSAVGVFFKKRSYRSEAGLGTMPVLVAKSLTAPIAEVDAVAGSIDSAEPAGDPTNFEAPRGESLGRALLADLGVDLAALDRVRDRKPLGPSESTAFYDLLSAVETTPPTQLVRLARLGLADYAVRRQVDETDSTRERQLARAVQRSASEGRYAVAALFGDGAAERGELLVFDGVVRRVTRIDATDSRVAAERGLDAYYELELFTDDSQNLPVVFCMRALPVGFPIGPSVRQPARVAGFFFKQWAYRTRRPREGDPTRDRRQFAPLLIGRAPIVMVDPDAGSPRGGLAVGVAATLALALVTLALWRAGRGDRRYEAGTLSRMRTPDGLDFDKLASVDDGPDTDTGATREVDASADASPPAR